MMWKGKFFGALIGFMITQRVWGAVIGALMGHMYDQSMEQGGGTGAHAAHPGQFSVPQEFFRTTFELMGHVAKSDGRVSEAEIGAARRVMQELQLGERDVSGAIECFRTGKSPGYDADLAVERLREACGQRYDIKAAFMELQLRAALAGDGLPLPARAILTRVAARLGMSPVEFAYMEASLRARQRAQGFSSAGARPGAGTGAGAGSRSGAGAELGSLAAWYAELGVEAAITDQEVTKAYRRQMSRHHPDKLVANGLPESMAQMAKEKTQRIQEAYEGIRAARGMR